LSPKSSRSELSENGFDDEDWLLHMELASGRRASSRYIGLVVVVGVRTNAGLDDRAAGRAIAEAQVDLAPHIAGNAAMGINHCRHGHDPASTSS
jgi:hypothetical protein